MRNNESFLQHSDHGAAARARAVLQKALEPQRGRAPFPHPHTACNKTTAMTGAGSLIFHGELKH